MSRIAESLKGHVSLSGTIDSYIRERRPGLKGELDFYRRQTSLREAVRKAALSMRRDGRRHNHQRRLKPTVLERAADRLESALTRLRRCKDFGALMRVVEDELGGVHGVGELTRYDITLRIGAKLGLEPKKAYLHAGTRQGAKAIGRDSKRDSVEMRDLPPQFRRLKPCEIEDCLCIYKDQLEEIDRWSSAWLTRVRSHRSTRARGCR